MGWWELKDNLKPRDCLMLGGKDDLGENMTEVIDLINIDVEDGYKFSEVDAEHITSLLRIGCTSGQINDWDWLSEQESEITN